MADQVVGQASYKDMLNGTFAEVVVPMRPPWATTVLNDNRVGVTNSGNSGDLFVALDFIAVDINLTAISGTTPGITFTLSRKAADGVYYALWSPAQLTAAGQLSTSVGPGLVINQALGDTIRLSWAISGATPSMSWTASIKGR